MLCSFISAPLKAPSNDKFASDWPTNVCTIGSRPLVIKPTIISALRMNGPVGSISNPPIKVHEQAYVKARGKHKKKKIAQLADKVCLPVLLSFLHE